MLRITIHEDTPSLTFQLEGRLAGRWVGELQDCWHRTLVMPQKPIVLVDLTGVTFVDPEGQALLVALHRSGAELVAVDCLIKAVVDEITQGHSSNSARQK